MFERLNAASSLPALVVPAPGVTNPLEFAESERELLRAKTLERGAILFRGFVAFPWRKRDVLMVDNWQVSHGRRPFTGDRKVLVAMAEALSA